MVPQLSQGLWLRVTDRPVLSCLFILVVLAASNTCSEPFLVRPASIACKNLCDVAMPCQVFRFGVVCGSHNSCRGSYSRLQCGDDQSGQCAADEKHFPIPKSRSTEL